MRHVDEGTLHELIDGSLAPPEAARVNAHLASCESCRARLGEARTLVRETADLIVSLDSPGQAAPSASTAGRQRSRPIALLGWAASIAMAVGIGFALNRPMQSPAVPAADQIEGPSGSLSAQRPIATATPPHPSNVPAVERRDRGSASRRDAAVPPRPPQKGASTAPAPAPANAPSPVPTLLRSHPDPAIALDATPAAGPHGPDSGSITLDEAVRRLGGSIRLIDGLNPISVARVPGSAVVGADPGRDAVVVRYLDPAFGVVQLAQQRILTADSLDASAPQPDVAEPTASAKMSKSANREQVAVVSWKDGHGFQMTLTAAAPAESLAALRARVH